MMLEIYCTRNKKSGQFGQLDLKPFDEKVAVESYSTSVLEAPQKDRVLLDELDLYHIGTYDTATGKIIAIDPTLILDLGAVTYEGRK